MVSSGWRQFTVSIATRCIFQSGDSPNPLKEWDNKLINPPLSGDLRDVDQHYFTFE